MRVLHEKFDGEQLIDVLLTSEELASVDSGEMPLLKLMVSGRPFTIAILRDFEVEEDYDG